jgi:hypothetical protein
MKLRRCLIPADGFYEWVRPGPKDKQAYNFAWRTIRRLPLPACGNDGEITTARR